jgi:hypothetical protein
MYVCMYAWLLTSWNVHWHRCMYVYSRRGKFTGTWATCSCVCMYACMHACLGWLLLTSWNVHWHIIGPHVRHLAGVSRVVQHGHSQGPHRNDKTCQGDCRRHPSCHGWWQIHPKTTWKTLLVAALKITCLFVFLLPKKPTYREFAKHHITHKLLRQKAANKTAQRRVDRSKNPLC